MAHNSIVVQLDPAVEARLAALARERQQPVAHVAAEVIASFVDPESWEHKHIQAGLAELDAGCEVDNERVMEWLDSWGKDDELPAPK